MFMQRQGGAVSKLKKYPNIIEYVEAKHPVLYEVINDLAMRGQLNPRRGEGLTFIVPDDKVMKKIADLTYSDTPEVAADMLSDHILTDCLKEVSDWKEGDIANRRGMKLVVKSAEGSKVVLGNDTNLIPAKDFIAFSTRENIAVWRSDGPLPEATARAEKRRPPVKKGAHRGGNVVSSDTEECSKFYRELSEKFLREDVGKDVQTTYTAAIVAAYQVLGGKIATEGGGDCACGGDEDDLRMTGLIAAFVCANPLISGLVLFHGGLLPEAVLKRIIPAIKAGVANAAEKYKKLMEVWPTGDAADALRATREHVAATVSGAKLGDVEKIYENLQRDNVLDGKQIYPAEVHAWLASAPAGILRAAHLLMYRLNQRYQEAMKEAAVDARRGLMREMFSDVSRELNLREPSRQTLVTPGALPLGEETDNCVNFCHSQWFLYAPALATSREILGAAEDEEGVESSEEVEVPIGDEDKETISEQCRLELRKYLEKHGRLPAATEL